MRSALLTRSAKLALVAVTFGCGGRVQPDTSTSAAESSTSAERSSASTSNGAAGTPASIGVTSSAAAPANGTQPPCLLAYNTAPLDLSSGVPSSPGACCRYAGEPAECDTSATCGPAAGAGCCLIYATAAAGFSACCFYERGLKPPSDSRCLALLQ